eukprot:CAMPEP_0175141862 /NCGR_PEP_ID=MMETSP0087-20121206/12389_1 /TAXON_ID=136419 /ORGANISM="Unknown Unknown, Strain D1" /LENGTH=266 /DNA_ID=CAMNT_0016425421 /DNA_START=91 /DNA_END=891 /DNA_ORIENTATION=-
MENGEREMQELVDKLKSALIKDNGGEKNFDFSSVVSGKDDRAKINPNSAVQVHIKEATDILIYRNNRKTLSMQDIADHKQFLQNVMGVLNNRKAKLQKRFTVISALLKNSKLDSKRHSKFSAELSQMHQSEKNFNEDVGYLNNELQAFESSPAYKKTVEYVETHWTSYNGFYMKKEDPADSEVCFTTLLNEEKNKEQEKDKVEVEEDLSEEAQEKRRKLRERRKNKKKRQKEKKAAETSQGVDAWMTSPPTSSHSWGGCVVRPLDG